MSSDEPFSVEVLLQANIDIMSLLQRHRGRASFAGIVRAFENARMRLRSDAREIGDPLYHLRTMKMTIMGIVEMPLYVDYVVHDERNVVVIRSVQLIR